MEHDYTGAVPLPWRDGRHKAERRMHLRGEEVLVGIVFTAKRGAWDRRAAGASSAAETSRSPAMAGLSFVIAGSAEYRSATGSRYRVVPGTLFQPWRARDGSTGQLESWSGDFQECTLYLLGGMARRFVELGILDHAWDIARAREPERSVADYIDLFRLLVEAQAEPGRVVRGVIAFVERLYEQVERPLAGDDWAARACALLAEHVEPAYTAAAAAAELDIPYRRFREQFRESVGLAPGEYQLQQRMGRACELLQRLPVGVVAERLGYRSAAQFSRQFKQVVGTTPRDFRAEAGA